MAPSTDRASPGSKGPSNVVVSFPVKRSFRAHPAALSQVREFVRAQAGTDHLTNAVTDDLVLAVSEACVNSVIHTNSSRIEIAWRRQDGHVDVLVQDEGVFDRKVPLPEFDGTAGRGIPIMLALVDEVTIREGTPARPGTQVRLRMSVPHHERSAAV
jgi:anti-sigma regulatory factor (Ser/Thr protein kinase)